MSNLMHATEQIPMKANRQMTFVASVNGHAQAVVLIAQDDELRDGAYPGAEQSHVSLRRTEYEGQRPPLRRLAA